MNGVTMKIRWWYFKRLVLDLGILSTHWKDGFNCTNMVSVGLKKMYQGEIILQLFMVKSERKGQILLKYIFSSTPCNTSQHL